MGDRTKTCALAALAKAKDPRATAWWGRHNTLDQREYRCYICGHAIDYEPNLHQVTRRVGRSLDAHQRKHHDVATELIESGLWPVSEALVKRTYLFVNSFTPIPGRLIANVWCVSYGVFLVLNLATPTAGKVARRSVMARLYTDSVFHDALDAAAAVPAGVTNFLRGQGYAIEEAA